MVTFLKALKEEYNDFFKNGQSLDRLSRWIFVILTGFGAFGILFAGAAHVSKMKQFASIMMSLTFAFLLNLMTNVVFILEQKIDVQQQKGESKQLSTNLLWSLISLLVFETTLQIIFLTNAMCKVNTDPKNKNNLLKSATDKNVFISVIILDNFGIELAYTCLAFWLWTITSSDNYAPLSGVIAAFVFGCITTGFDIYSIKKGKTLSERRQAQLILVVRMITGVTNCITAIIFFIDCRIKVADLDQVSLHGQRANWAILILVTLQVIVQTPVYFSPGFSKGIRELVFLIDIFGTQLLQCGVIISSCIVYFAISNGSLPLLVSVFVSWAMNNFMMWYQFGEICQYEQDGIIQNVYQRSYTTKQTSTRNIIPISEVPIAEKMKVTNLEMSESESLG